MPRLPDLIGPADLARFGYEAAAATKAAAASARVRRHTRQQITAGTSRLTLAGPGPWRLPQRPVRAITSLTDADGTPVPFTRNGSHLTATACGPLVVVYEHGWPELPDELAELVCSIAARLAAIPDAMLTGARTEQAGGESVTWGTDAYAGTTGLTSAEADALDALFPTLPRSTRLY
ncbi:hypothetical protein [Glycomyces sp. NPDC048151]|uniref:hypothetical protein n=1 Tax=Glycomyces sp. NPDC048151 TaxID=3364002 RepID=UPI003710EB6E